MKWFNPTKKQHWLPILAIARGAFLTSCQVPTSMNSNDPEYVTINDSASVF